MGVEVELRREFEAIPFRLVKRGTVEKKNTTELAGMRGTHRRILNGWVCCYSACWLHPVNWSRGRKFENPRVETEEVLFRKEVLVSI